MVQRDGISPELRRVLRRPQRELLFFGSSRSNDQGVHDQGLTPERLVDVRLRRQRRLRGDNPLRVHAVIWEAALRQMIGGPRVMRQQLEHLCALADQPNIDVQVLPFRAGVHSCGGGPFNILSFAESGALDVVHMDGLRSTNWVEGAEESAAYTDLFARTCATSLSPYDSLRLIESIAKGMNE
nr:DUF5753 domain-containing protein [Streptomyces brevispora]